MADFDPNGKDYTGHDVSGVNFAHNDRKNNDKQSMVAEIFDYYELCIYSLCAVIVLFSFFIRLCRVDGQSMEDTLHHGEMLVVSDVFYTPERGDIIVFHQTGSQSQGVYWGYSLNEPVVKRVIATGGEWIDIDYVDGKLEVTIYDSNMENPRVLDETYAKYSGVALANPAGSYSYPLRIPEGYVFVMGDNRWHSSDSRSSIIGLVDTRRILGHALMRLTPFDKMGAVD